MAQPNVSEDPQNGVMHVNGTTNNEKNHAGLSINSKAPLSAHSLPSEVVAPGTPGLRSQDVYDATLSWWRAAVRTRLLKNIEWESKILGRMQVR